MLVGKKAKKKNCPFCFLDLKINVVLEESEHFLIINNIKPLIKGHIMLITRYHLRDEIEFPYYMYGEFTSMSIKARKIVAGRGVKAMSFVNAPQDQSVLHYHRHFLSGIFGVHGVDEALRTAIKDRRHLPSKKKPFWGILRAFSLKL